ncbi:hypothetical protein H0H92_005504 [Tricholoma furcatifolium]|nr:hypothetical protein H0H92_005504 [Tricholoma furcatifolium]
MNDPGFDKPLQECFVNVTHNLKREMQDDIESQGSTGLRAEFRHELQVDEDEEEVGVNQPKRWWFINAMGAYLFKAYPPSFNTLTIPQRTLMLQTVTYFLYLALGAGVFSAIEGWQFCDGLYWADYTLLTIGLGTDFPLKRTASRALLIPYAAVGIMMIGLVVGSVRGLVLERAKTEVAQRSLAKQRETFGARRRGAAATSSQGAWNKEEFDCMRRIDRRAGLVQQYSALGSSFVAFLIVWTMGALVFWFSEMKPQSWTYFEALYFSYTSLLTIGYGDFYPQSNSGKPFFVVWSLIAVPTVTVLISNIGDTVVGYIKAGLFWVGERTLLPERRKKLETKSVSTSSGSSREGKQKERDDRASGSGSENESDSVRELKGDVERLGEAIEKGEETRGREGSLAARIAKEIRRLAQDIHTRTEVKYEWDEWLKWLEMLDMDNNSQAAAAGGGEASESVSDAPSWSWLADDGPLFSRVTETEWVLSRLCSRLEQVLEQELEDARRGSYSV